MTTDNQSNDYVADAIADFQADIGLTESTSAPEEVQSVEDVAEEETDHSPESEVDAEEEAVESENETEDAEEEDSEPELPEVEYVKADGKRIKIDYSDRDHIKRVYQKFAAQTRYQSERDTARKELSELKDAHSKVMETMDLLNANIENPERMYELFTGGKSLRDQFKEWQKEEDAFHLMSESEKKAYLSAKEMDKRTKELERKEAALQRKLEESEKKESDAHLANQQALVNSSFEKYRFNDVTDAEKALSLDKRLWNDVINRLGEYDSINKEIIDKEMKEAAEAIKFLFGDLNRQEQKKEVRRKKATAKKAAAKAASKPASDNAMIAGLSGFFKR